MTGEYIRINTIVYRQNEMTLIKRLPLLISSGVMLVLISACAPTVKVAAPDEPITINLNVKIEHEVRVKIDKELDQVFSKEAGLF